MHMKKLGFGLMRLPLIDENDGRELQKISQADAFSLLYGYVSGVLSEEDEKTFSNLMHEDFARREVRKMPRMK